MIKIARQASAHALRFGGMKVASNKAARQLSSMPQAHRLSTLQAISSTHHDLNAKIVHLVHEANKAKELFKQMPASVSSRIDWIHRQVIKT